MMNASEYEKSLRKLNLIVYLFGRQIVNVVALTYDLAHDPDHADLMTARSHLTGEKINRFCHIHQSAEDLVKKTDMGRLLGAMTGSCFQRCVGMDAVNRSRARLPTPLHTLRRVWPGLWSYARRQNGPAAL